MGKKKCTLHCDVTLAKAATLVHKSDDAQRQQEKEGEVCWGEKWTIMLNIIYAFYH